MKNHLFGLSCHRNGENVTKLFLRVIAATLFCVCLLCLSACGNEKKTNQSSGNNTETPGGQEEKRRVDVDLSVLSGTMVYAEVYRIMSAPYDYAGKTIKVKGTYTASYYEPTQKYYSYVVVADATACCSQGFEFEWVGKSYPEDYPDEGDTIEVVGVFDSYDELGMTYYSLTVDSLRIL